MRAAPRAPRRARTLGERDPSRDDVCAEPAALSPPPLVLPLRAPCPRPPSLAALSSYEREKFENCRGSDWQGGYFEAPLTPSEMARDSRTRTVEECGGFDKTVGGETFAHEETR